MAHEYGTCQLHRQVGKCQEHRPNWLLPTASAKCTMKSDRRKASSSDPPTTGSSGDPRGYRSEIASPQASREPAIELGGPAIPLHPPRPLPLCMSARRPARHRRQKPRVPGRQPVIRCTIPWKHRWAGAATPTQRNTARTREPPRRASDVINGTNLFQKDNPRWTIGNATETIKVPDAGLPPPREPAPVPPGPAVSRTWVSNHPAAAVWDALRTAAGIALAWLAGLPRRAGNRLFAMNDAEAGWRGWQVTELAGGLARQYRDARFDTLRAQLDARGGGVELDTQRDTWTHVQEPPRCDPVSSGGDDPPEPPRCDPVSSGGDDPPEPPRFDLEGER
jgi:hypothetical protein